MKILQAAMTKHGKQRKETGKGIFKNFRVVKACLIRLVLAIMLHHNGYGIAVCLSTHGTRANTPQSSSGKQMSEKSQAQIEYEEVNGSLYPEQVCDHKQRMRHVRRALRQQQEQRKNKWEWWNCPWRGCASGSFRPGAERWWECCRCRFYHWPRHRHWCRCPPW